MSENPNALKVAIRFNMGVVSKRASMPSKSIQHEFILQVSCEFLDLHHKNVKTNTPEFR